MPKWLTGDPKVLETATPLNGRSTYKIRELNLFDGIVQPCSTIEKAREPLEPFSYWSQHLARQTLPSTLPVFASSLP